jgi:hypothetical protein
MIEKGSLSSYPAEGPQGLPHFYYPADNQLMSRGLWQLYEEQLLTGISPRFQSG